MKKTLIAVVAVFVLLGAAFAAQKAPSATAQKAPAAAAQKAPAAAAKKPAAPKSLDLKTLPPAVQNGIQAETKGATIKNISKEVEDGKTQYEVETTVNGKSRDLTFDSAGTTIEIEQEVTLDSIPAPVRAAIEKKTAGGKITKVETVTRGKTTTYEATFTTKAGKTSEVAVNADGSVAKSVEK
jgi:uncharacterized membrane protein YkoI